ncbi:MAG: DUF2092 domain-containing protein [Betaproteobacteria bacterium]
MTHVKTHGLARPPAWLAVLAIAFAIGPARAADPAPAPEVSSQDRAARELLLGMAEFMARAPAMSVTMRSGYDAIQADGQRIEFGERRRILMQRPDKIRVEVERSDGERGTVVFDGRWITVFKPAENVYARVEKPGSLDQALVYMVRDLRATLPLARMFTTGFPVDLDKRAASVTFVEECTLFDVPTDHVAVRSAEVDLQLWIAKGPQPLPRRVVITYKNAPGQPQFRADLYDWSVPAKQDAAAFAFVPPAGAEQIMYLAPRPPAGETTRPTGEQR